jgi:cytochrome c peroxidase
MKIIVGIVAAILALPAFAADPGTQWQSLPLQAPEPKDNPASPAKVELGKMLYFDPRFSETGTVSCFSCHNVMEGGDDHRPTSIGVHGQKGDRNAPTVWNAAFLSSQFWDGRAGTLEDQAKGPVTNPV